MHSETREAPKTNKREQKYIHLRYFRKSRSARQVVTERGQKKITAAPEEDDSCRDKSDWLKRDVSQMSSKASNGISKCNVDVSSHFLRQ